MTFFAIIVLVALVLLAAKTLNLNRLGSPRPRRTRHDTSAWGRRDGTTPPDEEQ